MLNIFYGSSGTGKSYAMMDRIKEDAERGGKVCVVVPDQFTFEYERMLYNHLGCALFNRGNTEVWSFSRLTRDIFRQTRAPEGRGADKTVKTAVMYTSVQDCLEEGGLPFFEKQAKHPSFVNTALTMISELVHSGVTPEVLGDILKKAPENMQSKLEDIFTLYSRFSSKLSALGMRDITADPRLAAAYALENGYFSGMSIFMDEFKSFTGDQLGMIKAMLSDCASLTVCMTSDDIYDTGFTPFSSVNDTAAKLISAARELGIKVSASGFTENRRYLSQGLFELSRKVMRSPQEHSSSDGSSITLFRAPDIYGECDFICAEIKELISKDSSLRYSDIAVLDRTMNDDISVLSAHFERYGIPYYSDKKESAAHKPLMLMITSALELCAAKSISTEALLRYAKTGLSPLSREEISELENYCYQWDIDGSLWNEEFPDERENGLKNAILAPLYELKKNCADRTGAEICGAIREFIDRTGAETTLLSRNLSYLSQAEAASEARENERLLGELDSLLASLESALPEKLSISRFRDIFMLSAAGLTLSVPPECLDCVRAQQSDLARLSEPKVVFVMHANDGIFPFVTGDSATFSERERDFFRNMDRELSGSMKKRMAEERYNALKALCYPSERLYVSYSAADPSGKALYPSSVIGRIETCVEGVRHIDAEDLDMIFYCRTKESAYAAAASGYDPADRDFSTVRRELSEDPLYKRKFGYIDSIDTGRHHRIKDKDLIRKLWGDTVEISPSRFEDHSKCPFMFFCKTGLHIYPQKKTDLDAMMQGNIIHACMKDILGDNPKERFISMSEEDIRQSIQHSSEEYINTAMGGRFAKKKSFDHFRKSMEENLLTSVMHIQEELRVSDFVPDGFELPVGKKRGSREKLEVTPVIIECGEGLRLNFSGTADRIDTYTDSEGRKYIRIIDYKTGEKDFDLKELVHGLNLQMFFYLFSLIDEKGGRYCGCLPAGALYVPIKAPMLSKERDADADAAEKLIDKALAMKGLVLDDPEIINAMENNCQGRFIPVSYKKDGSLYASSSVADRELFDRIKELAGEHLRKLGDNISDGNFPADPLNFNNSMPCSYCDYRDICGNYPDPEERDISEIDTDILQPKKSGSS